MDQPAVATLISPKRLFRLTIRPIQDFLIRLVGHSRCRDAPTLKNPATMPRLGAQKRHERFRRVEPMYQAPATTDHRTPRQRRFRTWHFPTSACVMLETRLIEGMLLGRSAECCRSHQQRCTGLRAALQLKQLSCEVQPRGELHEMRNILVKLFIGTAITSIAMFGADNSIGTWKRNIEKSKSTPPATNPLTSLTIVNHSRPN
jgi:hypothetical protein